MLSISAFAMTLAWRMFSYRCGMESCWFESFSESGLEICQSRQRLLQIARQRCAPFPLFPAICDFQFFCVQKLSLQSVLFAKPLVKAEVTVLVVHDDGITEFGKVQTNLMQAARLDLNAREGGFRKSLLNSETGERANRVAFPSRKRKVNLAFIQWEAADDETEVFFADLARRKDAFQFIRRLLLFGDHQQPRCVFV